MKFSAIKPLLIGAGVLVLIDQLSKALVRAWLPVGIVYRPELELSRTLRLIHLKNYGALGGFMESYRWLIALLTALICAGIVLYYPRLAGGSRAARLSLTLLLAGGLGNLIDRVALGSVTDFISILNLPVMNIADLYVGAGLVALIFGIDDGGRRKAAAQPPQSAGQPPQSAGQPPSSGETRQ